MLPTLHTTQNKETDKLSNEMDKLLSDKYILAKEIRDLNKILENSVNRMSELESELKNTLTLKEKFDKQNNSIDEIKEESVSQASKKKALPDLPANNNKLTEHIKADIGVNLSDEIKILRTKIECRNNADSEVCIERDLLKVQLKTIEEEIAADIFTNVKP